MPPQAAPVSVGHVYAASFDDHLEQFRAHLSGSTGQPLPPSFIPPTGYWTSREKDIFFHALAVHSRLRPDLIAASIKSKTILDVCAYMDALDQAIAVKPFHGPSLRSVLEGAMEVSDSWVRYEEEQAGVLLNLEPAWEEAAEENKRYLLFASRFQDEEAFWSWKQEQACRWGKQDTMAKLNIHHLQALDRLFRNADPIEQPPQPPASASRDELVDPTLLASSSTHCTPQSFKEPIMSAAPSSPLPNNSHLPFEVPLSPHSRRLLKARLRMRKKRAKAAGTVANLTTSKLPPGLRKKSTRVYVWKARLKKYKPQKRKQLSGELSQEDEEGDAHQSDISAPLSVLESDEEDDATKTSTRIYHKADKGGMKELDKIGSVFKDKGIDENMATENGLHMFNLSMMGRLMRIFCSTYVDPDERTTISSISPYTVRLLHDILVDFTATAVHRAISSREQEIILKRKIKVWGLDEDEVEITSGNVREAIQMCGSSQHSLLSKDRLVETADDSGESQEQEPVEDETLFHARLPLHRELIPPFVLFSRRSEDTLLMPTETKDNEMLAELDDESALDEVDGESEIRYEKSLWQGLKAG
ncbi:hypothetical protein C8R43DRAFT_979740 [Mycena crocata]|nr:hypothetical protein C8R43DRAFT_979740 [Mycena crocata]